MIIKVHFQELDGMKEDQINLELIKPNMDWVEAAKPFIQKRIKKSYRFLNICYYFLFMFIHILYIKKNSRNSH